MENKIKFISFLDDDDKKLEGYYEVLEDNGIFIKFKTKGNMIFTIPYSRVLKIKEKGGENDS